MIFQAQAILRRQPRGHQMPAGNVGDLARVRLNIAVSYDRERSGYTRMMARRTVAKNDWGNIMRKSNATVRLRRGWLPFSKRYCDERRKQYCDGEKSCTNLLDRGKIHFRSEI